MYIVLKRMQVTGANMMSSYLSGGNISPMTYMGFARNLMIKLMAQQGRRSEGERSQVRAAIIHHHGELQGEMIKRRFRPAQYKGAVVTTGSRQGKEDYAGKSPTAMSLQPTLRGNVIATLIVEMDIDCRRPGNDSIKDIVMTMRLAGGTICDVASVEAFDTLDEIVVPNGFYIVERRDILASAPPEGRIAAYAKYVCRRARNDMAVHDAIAANGAGTNAIEIGKQVLKDDVDGWLFPASLGFNRLAVTASGDSYGEPLIGFVQYRSKRQVDLSSNGSIPFWQYEAKESLFYVTQPTKGASL